MSKLDRLSTIFEKSAQTYRNPRNPDKRRMVSVRPQKPGLPDYSDRTQFTEFGFKPSDDFVDPVKFEGETFEEESDAPGTPTAVEVSPSAAEPQEKMSPEDMEAYRLQDLEDKKRQRAAEREELLRQQSARGDQFRDFLQEARTTQKAPWVPNWENATDVLEQKTQRLEEIEAELAPLVQTMQTDAPDQRTQDKAIMKGLYWREVKPPVPPKRDDRTKIQKEKDREDEERFGLSVPEPDIFNAPKPVWILTTRQNTAKAEKLLKEKMSIEGELKSPTFMRLLETKQRAVERMTPKEDTSEENLQRLTARYVEQKQELETVTNQLKEVVKKVSKSRPDSVRQMDARKRGLAWFETERPKTFYRDPESVWVLAVAHKTAEARALLNQHARLEAALYSLQMFLENHAKTE